jgi:hypothetical protein
VTVSVLLQTGDGKFAAHVDYPASWAVEITPQSLALGDLNGDGKVDIAVATNYLEAGDVQILLGNGDGTFEKDDRPLYGGGHRVNSLVLADLNADGMLDIAASASADNSGQGVVVVSLGQGDGKFATTYYASGCGTRTLTLGDLNQDGKLDIATGNTDLTHTDVPNTVSVLFGNGDGTFAPRVDYPAAAASLALGDLNGDGQLDVVVATPTKSLEVLFGACR